jgi:DNA topoisomerase 2-associated protein PAT1
LFSSLKNLLKVALYSNPHPFVSLLIPAKGKRFLPRLTKFLGRDRNILLLTLLVATFAQQDVVIRAPLLDSLEPSEDRSDVERQTQTWLEGIPQAILPTIGHASLLHISSWLGMLLERTNVMTVASTEVRRFDIF